MRLSVIGVAASLAWALSTPATAQTSAASTTTTAQERALDSRIEKRIHDDPSLKKFDIKVRVDGGVATLSGTVATEAERTKAGELAKVSGVTRVDNKIVADLDAATRPQGTAGKVVDKTKSGGEKVVDKTKEGVSKTGEVITDSWITTRIKSKFMTDDALRASDIKVDSNDHVVTLSGSVVSPAAHAKAIGMAREVEGVNRVVDRLKIIPKG
jgi:hyperosmotically inducible periplasmic protein